MRDKTPSWVPRAFADRVMERNTNDHRIKEDLPFTSFFLPEVDGLEKNS